jgi:protein-S-isoprenylcysteine O-methyltransferase Ste14
MSATIFIWLINAFGLILNVAGITVLVWARQRLGRNWSQTVSVKEGHELVTSGPYRWIRHPMYTGGLIAFLGSAIVAGGAFVFLLLFLGAIFLWRRRRRQAHGARISERISRLQETDEGGDSLRVVIRALECLQQSHRRTRYVVPDG